MEDYIIKVKEFLSKKIDKINSIILDGYDGLSYFVNNPKSVSDPSIYREDFKNKLESYDYFDDSIEDGFNFNVPDMDNFDFSDLNLIRQILEGTAGYYVEISLEDVIKINEFLISNKEPIVGNTFLIPYSNYIKRAEKEILNKNLVKFPFSNTKPLDDEVFAPAVKYVNKNIDGWIDSAIKEK